MPEDNQYTFTHKGLTEMLDSGPPRRRWMLMLTLVSVLETSGRASEVVPGAIVTITNVRHSESARRKAISLDEDAAVEPQAKGNDDPSPGPGYS